jgi:hypothetical protein
MVKDKRKGGDKDAIWRWNRTHGPRSDDGKGSRLLCWLWQPGLR